MCVCAHVCARTRAEKLIERRGACVCARARMRVQKSWLIERRCGCVVCVCVCVLRTGAGF